MSNHNHTTAVCLVIIALTLIITVLFMMGPAIGIQPIITDLSADETGSFSSSDLDDSWDEANAVSISLDELSDSYTDTSGAYVLDGTLYIVSGGTYVLSGSLSDQQIIVQAKGTSVRLVLNGVTLTSADQPPIYVDKADKVFLTLAEGSENQIILSDTLSDTATAEDLDAAIYSTADLSINGTGSLYVQSVQYHGIKSLDNLIIASGNLTVEAGQNALHGRDSVRICGGTFSLTAGNDGIKANNDSDSEKGYILITDGTFQITADHDGIQAETDLTVEGGTFDITTGDGSSVSSMQSGMGPEGGFGMDGDMPDNGTMPGSNGNMAPNAPDTREDTEGTIPDMAGNTPGMRDIPEAEGNAPGMENMPDMEGNAPGMENTPDGNNPTDNENDFDKSDTDAESDSKKGLKAGNTLIISGGTFTLNTEDDCIHSDSAVQIQGGSFSLSSGDDGIHGNDAVTIEDGTITIMTSYEGVEGHTILISGGVLDIVASDDGMNASESSTAENSIPLLHITGGSISVNAGGDGLDSNGDLMIDGGTIYVNGPSDSGNGALDSGLENGGSLIINGGVILALGTSGMAETFENTSTQYSFICNLSNTFTEGEQLTITDSQGEILISYTITKSGNSIIYSDPNLTEGETYTITVGEESTEITLNSISTGNSIGGFGGGMNHMGGGFKDSMSGKWKK